jgi:hypothetical protein
MSALDEIRQPEVASTRRRRVLPSQAGDQPARSATLALGKEPEGAPKGAPRRIGPTAISPIRSSGAHRGRANAIVRSVTSGRTLQGAAPPDPGASGDPHCSLAWDAEAARSAVTNRRDSGSGNGLRRPFTHGYGTGEVAPTQAPTASDDATALPGSCLWAHGGKASTLCDMRIWSRALAPGPC